MKKLILIAGVVALVGCSKESTPQQTDNENMTQPAVAQPAVEKTPEQEGADKLLAAKSLPEALDLIKPIMSDEVDAFPASAGVLAIWMNSKHTTLQDIKALDSTTKGKILKDSYSERGKRLCVTGSIVEIQVDRSGNFPAYHAGIASNYSDVTRVLAIGSTGDLVAESNATFCGVVIGKVSYSNAAGGTTHAPYLVGMFELPENK
ncbi:hypothetical protein [Acinetobacter baumannii]|uniref:hypothetical protein n=1 Tax=Acinetobacter baumannii TaxID=470 RepID=UPI003A83C59D